jgi:hypothetical protein
MEWIRRGLKMVIWKFDQKNGGKGDKYVDIHLVDELTEYVSQELDKARGEGRREVYEAIVFDENIPHDITTFVAANLWKNMRDKAIEELDKLNNN